MRMGKVSTEVRKRRGELTGSEAAFQVFGATQEPVFRCLLDPGVGVFH